MFKLTTKNKYYALIVSLILFLFAFYKFSLSETINLLNLTNKNEEKLSWLKSKEKQIPFIKANLTKYENAYSGNELIFVREKLTKYISDFANKNNGCIVVEIPVNNFINIENLIVETNAYTVKGNYHQLLKLLSEMELNFKYLAKIVNIRFFVSTDRNFNKKQLFITIITQTYRKNENK